MAEETQYTAAMGQASVSSSANPNLDGTGSITSFGFGGTNGSVIKSIFVKAIDDTSQGMIRFYAISNGGTARLLGELEVPAVTISSRDAAFERRVELDLDLGINDSIGFSVETNDSFVFIIEALQWAYNSSGVRTDTTKYTANTGMTVISTANPELDGTGTLGTVLTAGTGINACKIDSISIKALQNTTPGMVRLYVQDSGGSTTTLFTEVPVPAVTKSSALTSFNYNLILNPPLYIPAQYKIMASTENAESFSVIAQSNDMSYLS